MLFVAFAAMRCIAHINCIFNKQKFLLLVLLWHFSMLSFFLPTPLPFFSVF